MPHGAYTLCLPPLEHWVTDTRFVVENCTRMQFKLFLHTFRCVCTCLVPYFVIGTHSEPLKTAPNGPLASDLGKKMKVDTIYVLMRSDDHLGNAKMSKKGTSLRRI